MKVVDAGMARVPRLYHYQRYVPKRDDPKRDDPKRLEQIVAGQVIYLSNPNDFTDNHVFSSALQVQYCGAYPVMDFPTMMRTRRSCRCSPRRLPGATNRNTGSSRRIKRPR